MPPPKSTSSLVVTTINVRTGEIVRKLTSPIPSQSPAWSVTSELPNSSFLAVGYFEKGHRFKVHLWRPVNTKKGARLFDVGHWERSAKIGFANRIGAYMVIIQTEMTP